MGRKERDADPYLPDGPGWYPDPFSATGTGERYFDGKQWGTTERPRGRESTVVVPMRRPRGRGSKRGRGGAALGGAALGGGGLKAFVARHRIPIILFLIGAAAVGLYLLQESRRTGGPNSASFGQDIGVVRPPAGTGASDTRLSPVPTTIAGPGGHEFQRLQPGSTDTPVAFDPCRPVHWVYNAAGAPADGLAIARAGFKRLAATTGLRFEFDGETGEVPNRDRAAYLPTQYDKDRWAPVLVAWSDENGFRDLIGHVAGATRPDMVTLPDGRSVYVSGVVVLDAVDLSEAAVPDRAIVRATVLHELGHLVGLDHTTDRTQLMFSETQPGIVDYGAGDRRGLAAEGSQACFPDV